MTVGKIENDLERGFAGKHRPNCLLITDPKNIETNNCSTIQIGANFDEFVGDAKIVTESDHLMKNKQ